MCDDVQTSRSEAAVETEPDCIPSFSGSQPDVWDSEGKVVTRNPLDSAVGLDPEEQQFQVKCRLVLAF